MRKKQHISEGQHGLVSCKAMSILLLIAVMIGLGLTETWAEQTEMQDSDYATLAPRIIIGDISRYALQPETDVVRIVLKFHEGSHVRLKDGILQPLARDAREQHYLKELNLTEKQMQADIDEIQVIMAENPLIMNIDRLFQTDETVLNQWKTEGEARSGRQLADLNLYYELVLPPGTLSIELEDSISVLNDLQSVEVCYAEPPTELAQSDIPPPTPDFEPLQGYLDPAPLGVDAYYAWTVTGGEGQNVTIVDVEMDWRVTHEDMPPLDPQGGVFTNDLDERNHGTAVMGVLVGVNNGYGVTGIAHQAQAGVWSINNGTNWNPAWAIQNAAIEAGVGGIVIIELQRHISGLSDEACDCSLPCPNEDCKRVPVEYMQAEYDVIEAATYNGTIVVEAAGNGMCDLDHADFDGVFDRSIRDSGAILVGGSLSTSRTPICLTNFGSRVDVHGWAENVTTMGYGYLFNGGGDEDQYYIDFFGGTSSASPIVAGAAACVQGVALVNGLGPLDSLTMRNLLSITGTPQDPDPRNIGPLPDLHNAIDQLLLNCSPPASGNWNIFQSCTFVGNDTAPADVFVDNNATLTIAEGAALDIDFVNYNLTVRQGSGVLIKSGGKIH